MCHINETSSPLITIICAYNSYTGKAQGLETLGEKIWSRQRSTRQDMIRGLTASSDPTELLNRARHFE